MLDEAVLRNEREERLAGDEVVFPTVLLAGSRGAGGVYNICVSEFPGKCFFGGGKRTVRDTEKPNLSGKSANRRFRSVDLPVPDGPEITMGRYFWTAMREVSVRGLAWGSHPKSVHVTMWKIQNLMMCSWPLSRKKHCEIIQGTELGDLVGIAMRSSCVL